VIYLLAYGAFFYQHGFAIRDFLILQGRMLQYHLHHIRIQPENSSPWTWPLLLHPIQYWARLSGPTSEHIVALGNPALWWGFLLLLPVGLVTLVVRPQWQDAVIFGGYAILYLPWLLITRSQFYFYMLPAVPFMCLVVAGTLRKLPRRLARPMSWAFTAAVIVTALLYAPIWIGQPISPGRADQLRLVAGWPI
jgi:dolichyl-phosphate-mannose--protein O-mannosyl transferase